MTKVVEGVSEERISAIMKKLESFGTRYVLSEKDNPTHGIGGAQHWIFDEFKSYSPRLQVSYDTFTVKKSQRIPQDTELANVVAVLPGTINKDRYVIIGGHYDSIALAPLRRRDRPRNRATKARAPPPTPTRWHPAWPMTPAAPPPSWNWRAS